MSAMLMQLMAAFDDDTAAGPSVTVAPTKTISTARINLTCTAKIKVDADGDLYETDNTGVYSSYETWLDSGANTEVWVEMNEFGTGTALTTDAGEGIRLLCSTDREWGYVKGVEGLSSGVFDFDFYDAAVGGTLLDSQRVTLSAEYVVI